MMRGINCLIKKINPKVKYEFKELVFEALNGNVDALINISERMYCGILYNVSLFIPEYNLILENNSCASNRRLENLRQNSL